MGVYGACPECGWAMTNSSTGRCPDCAGRPPRYHMNPLAVALLVALTPIAIATLLLSACATPRPALSVALPPEVHLDHDRALVCAYQVSANRLACVTPEEYEIRHEMEGK